MVKFITNVANIAKTNEEKPKWLVNLPQAGYALLAVCDTEEEANVVVMELDSMPQRVETVISYKLHGLEGFGTNVPLERDVAMARFLETLEEEEVMRIFESLSSKRLETFKNLYLSYAKSYGKNPDGSMR